MFNEWYLARNKGVMSDEYIVGYPTEWTGLIKKKGCILYHPTDASCQFVWSCREVNMGLFMSPKTCKAKFGHCPKKGELLYVRKTRSGWKSEKVELEFSE